MPLLTSSGWTPEALAWGVLLLAVAGKVMVTVRKAGGGCVAGDQPQHLQLLGALQAHTPGPLAGPLSRIIGGE